MLNATAQDSRKIEAMIMQILHEADAANQKQVVVNSRAFYRACALEKLQRSRFADEVNDILSDESVGEEFGLWVYAEYGDGLSIFCKTDLIGSQFDFASGKLVSFVHESADEDDGR